MRDDTGDRSNSRGHRIVLACPAVLKVGPVFAGIWISWGPILIGIKVKDMRILLPVGLLVLGISLFTAHWNSRHQYIFEADRVIEQTLFRNYIYPYEGMNVLIRRSWGGCRNSTGQQNVALQLRCGKKPVVTVSRGWRRAQEFQEAVRLMDTGNMPRKYL